MTTKTAQEERIAAAETRGVVAEMKKLAARVAALENADPMALLRAAEVELETYIEERKKEGIPYTQAMRMASTAKRVSFNLVFPSPLSGRK